MKIERTESSLLKQMEATRSDLSAKMTGIETKVNEQMKQVADELEQSRVDTQQLVENTI